MQAFRIWFSLALCWPVMGLLAQKDGCPSPPVILIHGFLGAADNYAPLAAQFQAAGWCSSSLIPYDWNTLNRNPQEISRLDSVVKAVLRQSGKRQVILIGHSAGGGLAYQYMADSLRSQRVARYVHIGSRPMAMAAGPGGRIPTLNIYSLSDKTVPGKDIPGATNLRLHTPDHFGLVTCDSTATAVLQFVQAPAGKVSAKASPTAEIQVLQMGSNQPEAGATLTYHLLQPDGSPAGKSLTTKTDAVGKARLQLTKGALQPLWVQCQPINGRAVAYCFTQIPAGPMPIYLRTLPSTGMVQLLLGGIPKNDRPAWVLFNAREAFLPNHGLLMAGTDTLNKPDWTPAAKTVVALFLYDHLADDKGSGQPIGLFGQAPFMQGIDYMLPDSGTIPLQWQGQRWLIPAVPSKEFVTIVVL